MLKEAGRGDMMAKFLGGGLSMRPIAPVQGQLKRMVAKSIQNNPRGSNPGRMVAGMAQEFSGRQVPPGNPWQNVMSNRGVMSASKIEQSAHVWPKAAGSLMGIGRMIPVGKALGSMVKKKAPMIAGRGAAAGQSLASEARAGMKAAPARPITLQKPMTPGGKPAPIMPEQPAGLYNPRPLVRPPNFNSTFDTSSLLGLPPTTQGKLPGLAAPALPAAGAAPGAAPGAAAGAPGLKPGLQGLPQGFKGTFGKLAALRLTPLARLIGNMPVKNFRF